MKKVVIAGFSGSGKSTLSVLLDGHPDLRVTYLVEEFPRLFTQALPTLRASGKVSPREIPGIPHFFLRLADGEEILVKLSVFKRLLYTQTYYPVVEQEAFTGRAASECTNQDIHGIELNLDFAAFEDRWKNRLFRDAGTFTEEQVIDHLYVSMFESIGDLDPIDPDRHTLVFNLSEKPALINWALRALPDAKMVVMTRPLEDFWPVVVDRIRATGIPQHEAEQTLLRMGRSRSQRELRDIYDDLAARHPQNVLILTIDDVVLNYRETMPKVAAFLGIPDDPILQRPTFHGREAPELRDYIGKVHDAGRLDSLSPESVALLRLQARDASMARAFATVGPRLGLRYAGLRWRLVLRPRLRRLVRQAIRREGKPS